MNEKKKRSSDFTRRQFLAAAAVGTGYSLIVKAPQSLAAPPDPMERPGATEELVQHGEQFHPLSPEDAPKADAEPNMRRVELEADVVVCGGGMAGVCAAISAARNGAKVILI
ncbi:MAG: FAD-dependent oxidoreductase, partial [Candidatus Hydrogenedentota bacterium]